MTDLELLEAQLFRLRSEFDDAFSRPAASRDQKLQSFVVLRCRGTKYAVALSEISLLQGNVRVARVPNGARRLMGICCVRGELLAVFDLATCLGHVAGERAGAANERLSNAVNTPSADGFASSWIMRASNTNAAFAFEQCEGLVAGAIQLTTSGERLVVVNSELVPLLPLSTLVTSARDTTSAGRASKEIET